MATLWIVRGGDVEGVTSGRTLRLESAWQGGQGDHVMSQGEALSSLLALPRSL